MILRGELDMNIPNNLFVYGFYVPTYKGNLGTYGAPHKPERLEVDICKLWIAEFIDARKTINHKRGSYALKHYVEDWADHYIPNGAFIQAAIELGFIFEVSGPNAWFNMSFTRAEKSQVIPSRFNDWSIEHGRGRCNPELKVLLDGEAEA